jgi:hypothetical protein
MNATHYARRKELFARTTSATLVVSLALLEEALVSGKATPEHRMARAWTIDELEERFPAAGLAVQSAFEAAETAPGEYVEVNYVAVLLANIQI